MNALDSLRSLAAGILHMLALLGLAGSAAAQTLDQQQLVYNGGTSARTLPGYTVWQSFQAGLSGTLTRIDMGFFNDMSGSGTLQIFAGEGTSGALLQTLTVPITGITQPAVTWNSWTVSVPVTAGAVYTFNITPDAASLPDPYGVCIGSKSPYPRGVMGLNDPSGTYPTTFDLVFRTFVTTGQPATYTISASASPANGGTVSGDGVLPGGTTANLLATAAPGFAFAGWTENGTVVSTSATYSFTVSGDRTLVANFSATPPPPPTTPGLVVPNAYQDTPAEMQVAGGAGGHYQQVFSSAEFWAASQTHTITAIAWRPGNALAPGTYTWSLPRLDVYLCTTDRAVNGLSTAYADNYAGATDRTLVYSGPITFTATVSSGGALNACNVVVPFQVPFSYKPANGNLLIDVIGYDFYLNLWDRQVELVGSSSVTSYLWGDHRYSTGTLNGFGGAGLVTAFTTDSAPPAQVAPSSISLQPSSLVGGATSLATVTLQGPAPAGGQAVTLASDSPYAVVPSSVVVLEGDTSASFAVATSAVESISVATITASSAGVTVGAELTLNPGPITPTSLTLSPSSVTGGASATGTVTLSRPAPVNGLAVALVSGDPAASVPSSVLVPAGASRADFTITTTAVNTTTTASITASAGGASLRTTLTINPATSSGPVLYNLDISSSMRSGSKTLGKIEIIPAAPAGGATILLTSSNPSAVNVPASVVVAAGKKQVSFSVTSGKVTQLTTVTVTATLGTSQLSTEVTVKP